MNTETKTTPSKKTLQSIDIKSLSKIVFILDLLLVLITFIPMLLISFAIDKVVPPELSTQASPFFFAKGFGMMSLMILVLHPLFMTLVAASVAACYNLVARKWGGIQFSIQ